MHISKNIKNSWSNFQKNSDILYRVKAVSETISEMVKTVLSVFTFMMPKTVNMQNMCGEIQGTIWMSQPLDEILSGLTNV